MSLIKYILKTDMKTKKADCAAFRELKTDIWHTENKLDVLRERITVRVERREDLYKPIYGCIQIVCPPDVMDSEAREAEKQATQCPYFADGKAIMGRCYKCPQYVNREKYQQLKQELAIKRVWLQNFWVNKFANVK